MPTTRGSEPNLDDNASERDEVWLAMKCQQPAYQITTPEAEGESEVADTTDQRSTTA
jgi:hypothetical protein